VPPHATYLFKHALVQDAAYGTLLRAPRHGLHARIVEALEHKFPEIAENQPEVLARHCSEGGMTTEAIEYYFLASKRATAAMNNIEARAHLNRGMNLLEQVPSSDPRKLQLRHRFAMGGWW
jgi:predicted ATPase